MVEKSKIRIGADYFYRCRTKCKVLSVNAITAICRIVGVKRQYIGAAYFSELSETKCHENH